MRKVFENSHGSSNREGFNRTNQQKWNGISGPIEKHANHSTSNRSSKKSRD